jgi:hypothetical protein
MRRRRGSGHAAGARVAVRWRRARHALAVGAERELPLARARRLRSCGRSGGCGGRDWLRGRRRGCRLRLLIPAARAPHAAAQTACRAALGAIGRVQGREDGAQHVGTAAHSHLIHVLADALCHAPYRSHNRRRGHGGQPGIARPRVGAAAAAGTCALGRGRPVLLLEPISSSRRSTADARGDDPALAPGPPAPPPGATAALTLAGASVQATALSGPRASFAPAAGGAPACLFRLRSSPAPPASAGSLRAPPQDTSARRLKVPACSRVGCTRIIGTACSVQ